VFAESKLIADIDSLAPTEVKDALSNPKVDALVQFFIVKHLGNSSPISIESFLKENGNQLTIPSPK
jgi:hypothetical protein